MVEHLVSLIVVNYNGFNDTCALIDSMAQHETHPYEIIVVDNGSARDEAALLKARYPEVKAVRSDENRGFAGGNNFGIKFATGEYLYLINNDVVTEGPVLDALTERLKDRKVGCVGSKIRYYANDLIQYAGATPMTPVTLRNGYVGDGERDEGQYDKACRTAFVCGASMMVRSADLAIYGAMSEDYFLYYEENDWCRQMERHGMEIWYEPAAVVFHKASASVGTDSPLKAYYMTRNRLLYACRNTENGGQRRLSYLYQTCVAFPKNVLMALLHGQGRLARAYVRGLRAGWKAIML